MKKRLKKRNEGGDGMANILQKIFPMIRTREEVWQEISEKEKLTGDLPAVEQRAAGGIFEFLLPGIRD